VQTLANGNRIVHKNTAQLARDREGRTRREQTLDAVGPWATSGEAVKFITLNDPVAGVMYHLDPKNNTATKLPAAGKGLAPPPLGALPHFFFQSVPPPLDAPPPEGAAVVAGVKSLIVTGGAAGVAASTQVMKFKEPSDAKTEALGQQTIEGVLATGTRTTRTIPAGAIGNDQPIEVVSETWYSADLQTVVMSKHNDPQIGETTYRLTNIQRTEPPPSLFEIHGNYTIREQEQPVVYEMASPPAAPTSK
jgi:hypothetical protein